MTLTPRFTRRALARFALAAVLAAAVGAAVAQQAQGGSQQLQGAGGAVNPPVPENPFVTGLCVHFDVSPGEEEWDAMESTGAKMVRVDMRWNELDNGSSYNWARCKKIYDDAAAHNMKVLFTVAYGNPHYPPNSPNLKDGPTGTGADACAAMCQQAAIQFPNAWFEIWNEQDVTGFWSSSTDALKDQAGRAADYAALLRKCYTAIKSVDSGIKVLLGGVATSGDLSDKPTVPLSWFQDLYNADNNIFQVCDAVAFHAYLRGEQELVRDLAQNVRTFVNGHGGSGKPLYCTEIGIEKESWLAAPMDANVYTTGSPNIVANSGSIGYTGSNSGYPGPSAVGWYGYFAMPTITAAGTVPFSGAVAKHMQPLTTGRSGVIARAGTAMQPDTYYTVSVFLRSGAAVPPIVHVGLDDDFDRVVQPTATWKRYSWTFKTGSSQLDEQLTRAFQAYTWQTSADWEVSSPMTVVSANQGAVGSSTRTTYETNFQHENQKLLPQQATQSMRGLLHAGVAGGFLFSWRDLTAVSYTSGIADASGTVKPYAAPYVPGCLTPPTS